MKYLLDDKDVRLILVNRNGWVPYDTAARWMGSYITHTEECPQKIFCAGGSLLDRILKEKYGELRITPSGSLLRESGLNDDEFIDPLTQATYLSAKLLHHIAGLVGWVYLMDSITQSMAELNLMRERNAPKPKEAESVKPPKRTYCGKKRPSKKSDAA